MARRALAVVPLVSLGLGLVAFLWILFHPHPAPGSLPDTKLSRKTTEEPLPPPQPDPADLVPRGILSIYIHKGELPQSGAQGTVQEAKGRSSVKFVTGETGRQEIKGIPAGSYDILVRFAGCAPEHREARIEPDKRTEIDIALRVGGKIHGTVTNSQGMPMPECFVRFSSPTKGTPVYSDLSTKTDSEGKYRVEGLPFEPLTLSIQNLRYRPWLKKDLLLREEVPDLQIDAVLDEGHKVTGRVVDQKGEPIAGASVLATNDYSFAAATDADGRFTIYGMAKDTMTLAVRAGGYGTRYLWQMPPTQDEVRIVLSIAGQISAHLLASPPPPALSAALVRYYPELAREYTMFTSPRWLPSGDLCLDDVDPGSYRVELVAPGYQTVDHPAVSVESGSCLEVTVRMVQTR
jgi:hypothetical protein